MDVDKELNEADEAYLSVEKIARVLGVSRNTVLKLIADKDLPIIRIGRLIRIKHSDFDAYLEKNIGKYVPRGPKRGVTYGSICNERDN